MNHPVRGVAQLAGLLWASLLTASAIAQPVITSLAPSSATAGASVVINGTGFASSATQNAVYFGTARATVTTVTATQLTVQVPVGASSVAPVTVTDLTNHKVGSSLSSTTPVFTLRFTGAPLNTNSYQAMVAAQNGGIGFVTADFNADNYADFAGLGQGGLLLTLSDGQGGYEPVVSLPAGAGPSYIKAADVDANGAVDLLVGASGQLLLLRNLSNGNGFTTATALYLNGEGLPQYGEITIDVGDMNADGLPDLVTLITDAAGNGGKQLVELRNNGNGFNAPTVLLRAQLEGLSVADFNQDNQLDVAVTSTGYPHSLILLKRNATNTGYATPESSSIGSNSNVLLGLPQVADINADGRPDVLTEGRIDGVTGIIVALRTTAGFSFQTPIYRGNSLGASLRPIADVDGDGLLDILMSTNNGLSVFRGQSGGSFSQPITFTSIGGGTSLVTGDFNNDGRSDIAGLSRSNGSLTILHYTGAVSNINNAPTLNALVDLTLNEDAPQQNIALSGISNGGDAGQAVTLTAVSSDPSLVPNPTISYFSPTSTGTLRLRPVPNAFGTCTITVTASDGQAQNGTISRTFLVTINPINDAPTLDPISDIVITTVENGDKAVNTVLSGITSGSTNENQVVSLGVTAYVPSVASSSPGNIIYTNPNASGEHRYSVSIYGGSARLLATVTITVSDGQSTNSTTSRTFRIYYNPGGTDPNQPAVAPSLDPIADIIVDRSLVLQAPVSLAGIGDGDPNQVLPLTVTATSSDPTLVTLGSVEYTSPNVTGSIPYTVSTTRGGTATISVTVNNGQSQNGSTTRSFRITVPPQVLGINDSQAIASKSVELYPNPAPNGRFWLKSETAGPAEVSIIDLTGRVVWQRRLTSVLQPQQLQLPSATTGMYIVRVRTAMGTTTQRMTVQ